MESSLSSGLLLTKASPPQKLQRIRKVDSNETVASKTMKMPKDKAPESSLLVSQNKQHFSSVQTGVQPQNCMISLGQIDSTNMTEGSSQSVKHWTQTPPTPDHLSPATAGSPQDEKPKSRNDISVTISQKMYHERSLPLEGAVQPTTDAGVHEGTVSTQRFSGSQKSGDLFTVPTTVLPEVFLPDEGHQRRKTSSRVSAGPAGAGASGDQENPEKANLYQGICFS